MYTQNGTPPCLYDTYEIFLKTMIIWLFAGPLFVLCKGGQAIFLKVRKSQIRIKVVVPRRLFFAAQQRIAITLSPNYYKKMQRFTTRKNQEEHGPDVM